MVTEADFALGFVAVYARIAVRDAVRKLLGYEDAGDTLLPEEVVGVASRELRERLEVMGWRADSLTRPALG